MVSTGAQENLVPRSTSIVGICSCSRNCAASRGQTSWLPSGVPARYIPSTPPLPDCRNPQFLASRALCSGPGASGSPPFARWSHNHPVHVAKCATSTHPLVWSLARLDICHGFIALAHVGYPLDRLARYCKSTVPIVAASPSGELLNIVGRFKSSYPRFEVTQQSSDSCMSVWEPAQIDYPQAIDRDFGLPRPLLAKLQLLPIQYWRTTMATRYLVLSTMVYSG